MFNLIQVLMTFLLQLSITFIGTYPTEFNDFARTIISLSDIGYQIIGATDAPAGSDTRVIKTNIYGEILNDSIPPFSELCATLTNDSNIIQTYIYENALVIQKSTPQNTEIWKQIFPEYSHYLPREILSCYDSGFIILSAFQLEDSSAQSLLKIDSFGLVEWETIIQNAMPIAITQNEYGSFLVTCLIDSGSKIISLDSFGEIQDEIDLLDIILRDIISFNGLIVVAAVDNGVICLDELGSIKWQYLPQDTIEIFSVSETFDGGIIASGSIMNNSERRALLLKLNQIGVGIWQNEFGFGESFRSIFVKTCSDLGYCMVGGYIENATLNTFVVKTDSVGNIIEQGFELDSSLVNANSILEIANPVTDRTVNILVNNFTQSYLTLNIRDVSGRMVYTRVLSGNSGEMQVAVNGLHTGIYFVSISTILAKDFSETHKITVID